MNQFECEQRQYPRNRFSEPVQYALEGEEALHGGVACDISKSGLKLNIFEFLPLNSNIFLSIAQSSNRILDCKGRVAWIRKLDSMDEGYQLGVKFDDIQVEM